MIGDNFNIGPLGMMGLSILGNAYGPNSRNAIGQGAMQGLLMHQQMQGADQMQKMRQMQLDELKRSSDDKQFVRDAAAKYFLSPEQQVLTGGQGPTNEAAAAIPTLKPKLDTEGFLGALMSRDPMLALNMRKSLAAEQPKAHLVTVQTPNGPMQKWVREGQSDGVEIGAPADKESSLPWYVRRENGKTMIDPAYADFERTKAAYGRPPAQPMAPVAYVDAQGQTVWGTINDARGRPAANYNPAIQGAVAQAKESGKTFGEEGAKAQIDAPRIVQNAETALRMSDELLKHPGFRQAVGASSMFGIQRIPGTQARDFMNRLDQIKGGAFLEAFNSLKGGGQITEVEGKKATDAIARMDNATSEQEFQAAVGDFQNVVRAGMNRAKMRSGTPANAAAGGAKFLGFE